MAGGKHLLGMPRGRHVFGTVKVGERGQIVIPKEAREMFGIEPGDMLVLLADKKRGIAHTCYLNDNKCGAKNLFYSVVTKNLLFG